MPQSSLVAAECPAATEYETGSFRYCRDLTVTLGKESSHADQEPCETHRRRGSGHGNGAAIALGILGGVIAGAAIASSQGGYYYQPAPAYYAPPAWYAPPAAYQPAPYGYAGYGYYGY